MNKKHDSDISGSQPLSKYAQKQLERSLGTRPEFEFKEKMLIFQPTAAVSMIENGPTIEAEVRVVTARIYRILPGSLFLMTKDGENIRMNTNKIRKGTFRKQIKIGTVVECLVAPDQTGRETQVQKMLSVVSL